MKSIIVLISILFLFSSCKTYQEKIKITEEKYKCNNDKSYEYLVCIEESVEYTINRNKYPTKEGMDFILNDCCEYVNALSKAKKLITLKK